LMVGQRPLDLVGLPEKRTIWCTPMIGLSRVAPRVFAAKAHTLRHPPMPKDIVNKVYVN
jgi:hypothetical protein